MKKLALLMFCLFFFSFRNCYSSWKFVYKQSNGYDVYVNFENIKSQNNLIYWNELVNFSESLAGIMSMTVFMEGDCKKVRQRAITFMYYSEHFGNKFLKTLELTYFFTLLNCNHIEKVFHYHYVFKKYL